MAPWRDKISLLMLKKIFIHECSKLVKTFSKLAAKNSVSRHSHIISSISPSPCQQNRKKKQKENSGQLFILLCIAFNIIKQAGNIRIKQVQLSTQQSYMYKLYSSLSMKVLGFFPSNYVHLPFTLLSVDSLLQ